MPTPRVTPDNLVRIEHVVSLIGKRALIRHRWFDSYSPRAVYVEGYSIGPRGAIRVHIYLRAGVQGDFVRRMRNYTDYSWTAF